MTLPDAWRIEVFRHPDREDPQGREVTDALVELGLAEADARPTVRVGRGVLLAPGYDAEAVEAIARELLVDPVLDQVRIVAPGARPEVPTDVTHRILVAPRPGVMDPLARTVEDLLVRMRRVPAGGTPGVTTFRAFELHDEHTPEALATLATRVLANETIESVLVDDEGLEYGTAFGTSGRGRVEVPLLEADETELERISVDGGLSLSLVEMQAIQTHFREVVRREPSACELETLAQTWSEHCKHKTLTGRIAFTGPDGAEEEIDNLLKETIGRATRELDRDFCVSVFEDNAGIVTFDRGQDLCIKVETHNHPSAIDPYGGAGTGIGGVIRDVLGAGLGARPIANTDCFFVGPPDLAETDLPKGTLHPRRILRGVVAGVRDYGNRMGIPTVNGGVWYHPGYVANPLVYAGTVGILPHECAFKRVEPGDLVVAVGGRTGRDGIHGATFSSIELSEESEVVSSSAVQIGDPITEKRVLDTLLAARDRGLYRAVTDCGAGGFSSAVGEMGERTGVEVDLARVPLKYAGLSSHEIWISEAQERMVLAVPPEHEEELVALFASEDVEATVIGRFTDTKTLVVRDEGEVIAELGMAFLFDGTPRPLRQAAWQPPAERSLALARPTSASDFGQRILTLLSSPDIASKEWILRQYDHEVQGRSVVKPLVGHESRGPSDGCVLQPLAESRRGLAISCGANPRVGLVDPYAMALTAIDEALRNAVAIGADPDCTAILDNFSWGNCDKPDRLGSLVLAAKACYDAAKAYRTPFVSGKDSLNNEYRVGDRTLSIPPTLLITALAQVPDVSRSVTMDLKEAGNAIYLVGHTDAAFGGSAYTDLLAKEGDEPELATRGRAPRPDLERAPALLRALHASFAAGEGPFAAARSCHDLSEGGLAVAAAEAVLASGRGLHLELASVPMRAGDPDAGAIDPDVLRLFSETPTRFLVEVPTSVESEWLAALEGHPVARIGEVTETARLVIHATDGTPLVDLAAADLGRAFQGGFQG